MRGVRISFGTILSLFVAGVPKHLAVFPVIFHSNFLMAKLKFGGSSPSKVLTQWVSLAILVRDGEDSDDGVAILPQLLVHLLAEQTLTNHCNLHPHTSLCSRETATHTSPTKKMFLISMSNYGLSIKQLKHHNCSSLYLAKGHLKLQENMNVIQPAH